MTAVTTTITMITVTPTSLHHQTSSTCMATPLATKENEQIIKKRENICIIFEAYRSLHPYIYFSKHPNHSKFNFYSGNTWDDLTELTPEHANILEDSV
jgi:hypothetical protein